MGQTSSKHSSYPPSSPMTSKSRRQGGGKGPQYNPDNESSAQLGQASSERSSHQMMGSVVSSERLETLGLGRWDTGTSDEATGMSSSAPSSRALPTMIKNGQQKKRKEKPRKNKEASGRSKSKERIEIVGGVFPLRETVDTARASMEAVRGSPALQPGEEKREGEGYETWCFVSSEEHQDMDVFGTGGWMTGEEGRKSECW